MSHQFDSDSIGFIAGRGVYPLLACRAARERGARRIVVVAVNDDTDPSIAELADDVTWVYAGQLDRAIKSLRRHGITQVIFAGQIKPGRLFHGLRPDFRAVKLLAKIRMKNAASIFSTIADEFQKDGITVLPATTFMEDSLAVAGVMGQVKPSAKVMADIDYGFELAREISRLDIGQMVVVKHGTVLAIEAFEGTDPAILRGGELGKGGVVCVKVAKPNQDLRFDVPCIGRRTVQTLIAAKAAAIAVQTGTTLLLERATVIADCNKAKIAVVGIDPEGVRNET